MNIKTKVAGAFMLAVLVLPGISLAQAMSNAELQAEIAALTAQLQALETQLQAQNGSNAWCYDFTTNLSIGMTGPAVTALQTALQKDGESVTVNGTFDDQTASAVTGFQEKYASQILTPNGLQYGTGYVGAATRSELNSLYGCGTTTATVVPPLPSQTSQSATTPTATTTQAAWVNLTINGSNGVVPVDSGSQLALAWTSNGVTNCTANSNSAWSGPQNPSGTFTTTAPIVAANTGLSYSLTCFTVSGGTTQSNVQIAVNPSSTVGDSSFTISPSTPSTFSQGSNNVLSWSGGACDVSLPNSCVLLKLQNASGACTDPTAGQPAGYSVPCDVGWIPTNFNLPSNGSFNWDAATDCGVAGQNGNWVDCNSVAPGIYRIIATDANGNSVSSGLINIVASNATSSQPSVSMSINGSNGTYAQDSVTLSQGTPYTIAWTSQNVVSCQETDFLNFSSSLDSYPSQTYSVPSSGSKTETAGMDGAPPYTKEFGITCSTASGGSAVSNTIVVRVN